MQSFQTQDFQLLDLVDLSHEEMVDSEGGGIWYAVGYAVGATARAFMDYHDSGAYQNHIM